MKDPFLPVEHSRGRAVMQSAIPKGDRGRSLGVLGLNLQGVVIKLYPRDNPPEGTTLPLCTYATVMVYGMRRQILPRVQITQPLGSLHTGLVGGLRGCTVPASGVLDLDHIDPINLDGSHVVISFLDADPGRPYISAILEHPNADLDGDLADPIEQRVRLAEADRTPMMLRWNGAAMGMDPDGNMLIDLERAHTGDLLDGGEEPEGEGGESGNLTIRVKDGSTLTITINGMSVVLEQADGAAKLTLGDGAYSVAVAEHLQTYVTQLTTWIQALFVTVPAIPLVPSAAIPTLPISASGNPPPPVWDPAIVSSKLKIPNT